MVAKGSTKNTPESEYLRSYTIKVANTDAFKKCD